MKHLRKGRTLGRDSKQRRALLAGLASSLFIHKRIITTQAKAKEARPFIEKLITKAKIDSPHRIRLIGKTIHKEAAKELFDKVAPYYKERNGGYTRIIKKEPRKGDGAQMAMVELVGFFENNKK